MIHKDIRARFSLGFTLRGLPKSKLGSPLCYEVGYKELLLGLRSPKKRSLQNLIENFKASVKQKYTF